MEGVREKSSGLVLLLQRHLAGKILTQRYTATGNGAGWIASLEITPLTLNKQTLSPYLGKDNSEAEKTKL